MGQFAIEASVRRYSQSELAIWGVDTEGGQYVLAQTGELFDINEDPLVEDLREINSLELGGITNDGRATFLLKFTDGSSGIFFAQIPSPSVLGDLDGDKVLTESDIKAFVQALTDPTGYAVAYPDLDQNNLGDYNNDGLLTNGDIVGFIDALNAAGIDSSIVPEPASLALLGLGGLLAFRRRR